MGRTYRNNNASRFDEESKSGRKAKHSGHSNNKRSGGMRVLNDPFGEDEDYFDDDVYMDDEIELNISHGQ